MKHLFLILSLFFCSTVFAKLIDPSVIEERFLKDLMPMQKLGVVPGTDTGCIVQVRQTKKENIPGGNRTYVNIFDIEQNPKSDFGYSSRRGCPEELINEPSHLKMINRMGTFGFPCFSRVGLIKPISYNGLEYILDDNKILFKILGEDGNELASCLIDTTNN